MSKNIAVAGRTPQLALSDFDVFRVVIGFLGDVASSLNAVLNFIQNLLNFLG